MPNVTVPARLEENGQSHTYFVDTVGTTSTTYTYPKQQDGLTVNNLGNSALTLTVNKIIYTIQGASSQVIVAPFTSFTIVAASGLQTFTVNAVENVNLIMNYPKNTVVIAGDSITNMNGSELVAVASSNLAAIGYFVWANVLLNQRLNLLANKGVSGERSDQLLARLDAIKLLKPAYCIVLIGKNDVVQVVNVETIKANILSICTQLISAGIIVIGCTITPSTPSTGSQVQDTIKVNNYIKSLQSSLKNFILCDWYEDIVDPATDLAVVNMLTDGIHPSTQGAYKLGNKLYQILDPLLPKVSVFSGGNTDATNLLVNGYFLGGATLAPSWTVAVITGTSTAAKVARANTNGLEWQEINISVLGTTTVFQQITTGFSPGDTLCAYMEYELDAAATSIDSYQGYIQYKRTDNSVSASSNTVQLASGDAIRFPSDIAKGIIYFPKVVVPSDCTKVMLAVDIKLLGKFRLGRTRLFKV